MSATVDARGFSCPQPVLLALREIDRLGSGEIAILVDTQTSVENVSRAATSRGWEVASVEPEGDAQRLLIRKT
jgi:TusA-related sulfurtransferase